MVTSTRRSSDGRMTMGESMHETSVAEKRCSFVSPATLRPVLVLALFVAALAIRLYRLDEAPRDFWTIRQYYNAMTARALYFQGNPDVPEWRRNVASTHRIWLAEPPILEYVVSRVYRVLGGERFWVFRSLTVAAWLAGGLFLFLAARRMLGFEGALTAAAFYLFLPYGVTASRSWQPDPLMVMGVAAAMLAIYAYFEKPLASRLVVAGLVAAVAILLKPGASVLTVVGMFGFLSLYERGWRRTFLPGPSWSFVAIMLTPPIAIVALSAWRGWYEPGTHFSTYLAPRLLLTFFFWKGWAGILTRVLTLPGLILALLGGVLLVPVGKARALVWGYVTGYALFSLICSFTTPNHDYWHLQVVPLAALCIGATAVPVWRAILEGSCRPWRVAFALTLGAIWILLSIERAPWIRDRGSSPAEYAAMAREIGDAVNHSTRVITLDYDFSNPLRYYAEIAGPVWPQAEAMVYDRQTGKDRAGDGTPLWNTLDLPAQERFDRFYADGQFEYFVVCRLIGDLDLQPGLREFLNQFPILKQGARYVIYDLRRASSRY